MHQPVSRQLSGPQEGLWAEVAAAALGVQVALQVVGQVGAGCKRCGAQVALEGLAPLVHQQVGAQVAPGGEALGAQVAAVATEGTAASVRRHRLLGRPPRCSVAALLPSNQVRPA